MSNRVCQRPITGNKVRNLIRHIIKAVIQGTDPITASRGGSRIEIALCKLDRCLFKDSYSSTKEPNEYGRIYEKTG